MGVKYTGVLTVSFRGGLVRMIAQWRIREDARKGSACAGAGYGWAPPPSMCVGGPAYPYQEDVEEAALARAWRMKKMRYELAEFERGLGESAPEVGVGGGDSKGVAAVGAMAGPAAIGEAVWAGKSGASPGAGGDKKVSAIKVSTLRHRMQISGV